MSSLHLSEPGNNPTPDLRPRITVIGVGGAGGNAVNNMIAASLEGVEFVVANTDSQALALSRTDRRIQLGLQVTHGLGAGNKPDVGRAAAEESLSDVLEQLKGSNMVFVAAGMGGGTGTGAAPVIARAAQEQGILTVGVVTRPFQFEGALRQRLAEQGIEEMRQVVDTLIIIPNQNLFRVANEKTTFADAFKLADDVLHSGVRAVTDLMVMPGLINLDFADVSTVMRGMGKAMMGTGEAEGEKRALDAAEAAISNPLLEDASIKGAHGVLINITGGPDLTLFEADEAANRIRDEVDADAQIIFGSTFDEKLQGKVRVSVVATGIDRAANIAADPKVLRLNPEQNRSVSQAAPAAVAEVRDPEGNYGNPTRTARPQQYGGPSAGQPSAPPSYQAQPAPHMAQPAPMPSASPQASAPQVSQPAPQPATPTGSKIQRQAAALMAAKMDMLPGLDEPAEEIPEPAPSAEKSGAFIPSPPADIHGRRFTPRRSDPFGTGGTDRGGPAQEEERPTSKRVSLYQRVTRRGVQPENTGQAPAMPAAQAEQRQPVHEPAPQAHMPHPQQPHPQQTHSEPEHPQQTHPQQQQDDWQSMPEPLPTPVAQPAPVARPGDHRTVSTYDAEDQLEIPTFLRRQAN